MWFTAVKKFISSGSLFFKVGHALRDGLCDPRLGPTELNDVCETCHLQGAFCPGHMGHIKLDVPVFNPLFYRFAYAVCFCFSINFLLFSLFYSRIF